MNKLMGQLTIDEELKGPWLFSCHNENGQQYIGAWIYGKEGETWWLYAPVTADRLAAYQSGKLWLHKLFDEPEKTLLFFVITKGDQIVLNSAVPSMLMDLVFVPGYEDSYFDDKMEMIRTGEVQQEVPTIEVIRGMLSRLNDRVKESSNE